MDNHGRIPYGNIDNINIQDYSMPYSIRTDYDKLFKEDGSRTYKCCF